MSQPKKLDVLDGLRGFAALLVVVFHYRLTCGRVAEPSWFARGLLPFRFGFSGVNLFLVLSGFCLTLSLIRRRNAGRPPTFRTFMVDRWRRIAPPFYAAMIVYLAAAPVLERFGAPPTGSTTNLLGQILSHLTFVHGLHPETICGVNEPFWSLSLEFQFYLSLPLLFTLSLGLGPWRVLAAVAIGSFLWRAWIVGQTPNTFFAVNGFLLARWAEFALGSAIAFWYSTPFRRAIAPQWAAATALLLLAAGSGLSLKNQVLWSDYVYGLGYGALLVAALVSGEAEGRLSRLLASRPMVWAGSISYSLYLTHSLVLAVVLTVSRRWVEHPNLASDLTTLATALGFSMVVAWGFASVFESPRRRFRPDGKVVTAPRPA